MKVIAIMALFLSVKFAYCQNIVVGDTVYPTAPVVSVQPEFTLVLPGTPLQVTEARPMDVMVQTPEGKRIPVARTRLVRTPLSEEAVKAAVQGRIAVIPILLADAQDKFTKISLRKMRKDVRGTLKSGGKDDADMSETKAVLEALRKEQGVLRQIASKY